ncbi:MAG: molybdate ABC transporter permease subunit [Clostridium sp.]|uniref:Molybdenum transport system permease n=1 Tax=Clostridium paraputrificum TaxID=29363 RepID=A0A6N3BWQ7_9CLOT|nr:molybdate ABC transporter permease subunit [Clostridium sp.]MBS5926756.1 molybdate ABC transporter permease subunit [Clostridium sp.]
MYEGPIIISLKTSIVSTIIVSILGILLANLLLKKEGKLKNFFESAIMLPLFMPPSLIGYILLMIIGKRSFIGSFLYEYFDFTFIFTWYGAVIAAVITSLPIMYGSAKGALLSIDDTYKEVAADLGATKFQTFYKVTLPLASKGILSGMVLSYARCFGEFGATMMIAGNIPGKTQNIPMAIYYAVERGDSSKANFFAVVVIIISTTLIFIYNRLLKENK